MRVRQRRRATRLDVRRTILAGFGLAFGLTLVIDLAILVVPIYDMQLYDRVLMSRNMDTVMVLSLACAIGLLFYGVLDYLRSAAFLAIANAVAHRLSRPALEEGVRHAADGEKGVGPQLIRDVHEVQSLLGSGAFATPLDALCAPMFVSVLFILHPAFGFLAIAGIAGLILAGLASEAMLHPIVHRAQARRRAADHALSRSLSETELTDGLGMLPAIARRWCLRYAGAVAELSHTSHVAELVAVVARLFRLILQAAVMVIGAVLIVRGQTTPGSLMGANLLLNKTLGPFDHLVGSCRTWMLAHGAWRRIAHLGSDAAEPTAAVTGDATPGLLIRGLQLRTAAGKILLDDISFTLPPGTFAVVSGSNGSGKTTLLRALAGVASPDRGCVLLDGDPVHGGPAIGYLPQSVSLLDATVAANIARLQDDLPGAISAARQASVHEQIGRMSGGYETLLSGAGGILSGGMRQRIGLARALFGGPKLLLLDEPDASLDSAGSDALLDAIRACCARGAIAVVISHRAALLAAADVVIELSDGRLTALRAPARSSASVAAAQLETA